METWGHNSHHGREMRSVFNYFVMLFIADGIGRKHVESIDETVADGPPPPSAVVPT